MTFSEAQKILMRITYKPGWNLCLQKKHEDTWLLWATFETLDCVSEEPVTLESRCWLVDDSFTEHDVVSTAFLCIQQSEMHECMEYFKLDNYSIFNPHITISAHKEAVRASFGFETLAQMGLK